MKLQFTKQAREEYLRIISVFADIVYHVTTTTIWIVDIWDRRNNPARLKARVK